MILLHIYHILQISLVFAHAYTMDIFWMTEAIALYTLDEKNGSIEARSPSPTYVSVIDILDIHLLSCLSSTQRFFHISPQ